MLSKIKEVADRYTEVERLLSLPDAVSDIDDYKKLNKEYALLKPIAEKYGEYLGLEKELEELRQLSGDPGADRELRELAKNELREHSEKISVIEEELKVMMLPKDPNDSKNVVVEIRAGAGGEEAALFAQVLYRMYNMYASANRFTLELVHENPTELGGLKEVTFTVSGDGAYSKFKFESGVHRVQRVPDTESQGRIQTSTVTVAVLPEAEEVDVEINPNDIKFESCKSSGAGGQHINKTESAVRLFHKPSGIVVECDEERSQFKNKDKALRILRTKLLDIKEREQKEKIDERRKSQVGTGDRSERIRTYNYPQGRVTDHRLGLTLYSLDKFLNGDMDPIVTALASAETAERLKSGEAGNI